MHKLTRNQNCNRPVRRIQRQLGTYGTSKVFPLECAGAEARGGRGSPAGQGAPPTARAMSFSEFQISRCPKRNAASSAARQKPVSIVLESSQLSTKQFGGTLGGPLRKNRLF